MTVYVAHAPADRAAAEALERVIERRGQFVELDDGQTALRPVQRGDVLVLLASSALLLATARLRLEQRALDAWAADRLIVVRLDRDAPPVGLRDLPSIDAAVETQRDLKWNEVADVVREKLRSPGQETAAMEAEPGPPDARPPVAQSALWRGVLSLLVAIPGLIALAAVVSIWLVNRIGPAPGGWPELVAGVEAFGARYGLPGQLTPWLFALTIAVSVIVACAALAGALPVRLRRKQGRRGGAVFVSYARANESVVLPVIEASSAAGSWTDRRSIAAGDGWAGEVARAIRQTAGVVVMCSRAAFESDHVKREVYLADRYGKKLMPVFIERAKPPDDFEYFFSGVQSLNLFETPEAERPRVLLRLVGAAP